MALDPDVMGLSFHLLLDECDKASFDAVDDLLQTLLKQRNSERTGKVVLFSEFEELAEEAFRLREVLIALVTT